MLNADSLAWGDAIVQYSKNLDSKFLDVNQHLPPLDPDPQSMRKFDEDLPRALLVRESYPKIYECLKKQWLSWSQDKSSSRGLVIIGQPGIGKTAFLFYALVRALKDGIPVDWRHLPARDDWIQFNGDKVDSVSHDGKRRLAFYDQAPPVKTRESIFIVQSTSPQRDKYKSWTKEARAKFWIMNKWTGREIDLETRYRGIETNQAGTEWYGMYSPREAFDIIGPSARRCFNPTPRRTQNAVSDFELERDIKFLFDSPTMLDRVIDFLVNPVPLADNFPPGFHTTFFARNVAEELQPVNHEGLSYKPGTQAQRDVIRLLVLQKKLRLDLKTASIFASNRAVGGYIFESFVLETLKHDSNPLELLTGPSSSTSTLINSPNSIVDFDPKETKMSVLAVDTIYSPTISNFPSLDFFFVTDVHNENDRHNIVMLQTTIGKKHTNSDKGIEQVISYVRSQPTLATRLGELYFAFVGPDGSIGAKLAGARSTGSDGTMTVSELTVNVGYVVVKVEDDIADILKKLSNNGYEEDEDEEEEEEGGKGEEGRMDVEP